MIIRAIDVAKPPAGSLTVSVWHAIFPTLGMRGKKSAHVTPHAEARPIVSARIH
jgi:hypothetical protein